MVGLNAPFELSKTDSEAVGAGPGEKSPVVGRAVFSTVSIVMAVSSDRAEGPGLKLRIFGGPVTGA
jgi:hypothetical protein